MSNLYFSKIFINTFIYKDLLEFYRKCFLFLVKIFSQTSFTASALIFFESGHQEVKLGEIKGQTYRIGVCLIVALSIDQYGSRGFKTFFMLNSTEHEISTAHKN